MERLKKMINDGLAFFGLQLKRLSVTNSNSYQLLQGLNWFDVDTVFDIGANKGQFAERLRRTGFEGNIVSFEPLSVAHAELSNNATLDNHWLVHERVAIGDKNSQVQINVAGNSVSSSVLPMLNSHKSAAIGSAYVSSESVPMRTLDSVATDYISPNSHYFIKIDTQGVEWEVLNGAVNTLNGAIGAQLELSLVSLYEGQRLWLDIIHRMEYEGFTLWALQHGFTDPRDGRTLQMDAIFFRLPT